MVTDMRAPDLGFVPALSTPLEPAPWRAAAGQTTASIGTQAVHATVFRRIEAAAASSCGRQHEHNEDAHSALEHAATLFVVADGVGGGAMAQLASRHLVDHLHAALAGARIDAERVRRVMLDADRAIAERIAKSTVEPGAATVAMCAPINVWASKWLLAWVGDCRVYRFATDRGECELLSRDDTFRHLGEQAPAGGTPDDPARMVGNGATTGANVALCDLASGELLVLCTDGIHKHIDPATWCGVLTQPVSLAARCAELIAVARGNGSADDATVLLVQRGGFGLPRTAR
jgi:serine/threonine protein phosphatase PrpC